MSADGRQGLTIIGFIGSVFSPYYSWSKTRNPYDYCSLNVALYGDNKRWAMTERGQRDVHVSGSELVIGPSAMHWDGTALTITIDEITAPFPSRLRGKVRLLPQALTSQSFALDAKGHHTWRPIAPSARVEVDLTAPECTWTGAGYLDTNSGDEPLEAAFAHWHWSRAKLKESSVVLYDVTRRAGDRLSLALEIDDAGDIRPLEVPAPAALPKTLWQIERKTGADGGQARVIKTLEDGPFYARSLLETTLKGEATTAMHESLSLDRFRSPLVRAMLPFRMPRAVW